MSRATEQSVLGCCSADPKAFHAASAILSVDDFAFPEHRAIWRLLAEMVEEGCALDAVTISEFAENRGVAGTFGGLAYLLEIHNTAWFPKHAEHYAKMVSGDAMRRRINAIGRSLAELELTGDEALDEAHRLIGSLSSRASATSVSIKDALKDVYRRMEERFAGVTLPVTPTPWDGLNTMLGGGLGNGKLYIVGGRPGMGKTAFMRGVSVAAADIGHACIISLEMDREEVAGMMLAGAANVSYQHIRDPRGMPGDDWAPITAGNQKLGVLPISICDMPALSLPAITAECRRLSAKARLSVVVIDYLGLIDLPEADRQDIAIGKVTRGLKRLAREIDAPVVLLCQLSRNVESRADKRPMLSDLRDAGQIEQDADGIMFLYRDRYYNPQSHFGNIAEIGLAKQRGGRTGVVPVVFREEQIEFVNYAGQWPIARDESDPQPTAPKSRGFRK